MSKYQQKVDAKVKSNVVIFPDINAVIFCFPIVILYIILST